MPNSTTYQNIPSGYFPTPGNTPTGAPYQIATDDPYITKDSYILTPEAIGFGITQTSSDGLYASGALQTVILDASSMVNRLAGRYFSCQQIDESKTNFTVKPYNPQLVTVNLQNSPYQQINSVYIQVLKWFIQIDITPGSGYLQDFPDRGFYRIVPMLSNAGAGTGSPIPSEIIDRQPLGIIWTNYTFGFSMPFTGYSLGTGDGKTTIFQAAIGNRLWAMGQNGQISGANALNVYVGGVLQTTNLYTVDYPNGIISFLTAPASGAVTVDFISNEAIPNDVRRCVTMLINDVVGKALQNPLGASSYSILSHSISFDDSIVKRAEAILAPYRKHSITII
jgi:hypothetical protein